MKKKTIFSLFLSLLSFLFVSPAMAQLSVQGKEQGVSYSGSTAVLVVSTPVNPNLLVTTGTNTFILGVTNPNAVARVYVTNDTANACSNLTLSIASAADSSLNSFNSSPQSWQTVQVLNASGTLVASTPLTVPATGTVAVTSAPILGNRVAIFVVLSSGCATTSVDIRVIFGTTASGGNQVQGLVPSGQAASGTNPFLVAGEDSSLNVQPLHTQSPGSSEGGVNGLALGLNTNGIEQSLNKEVSPNGNFGGLGTINYGVSTQSSSSAIPMQEMLGAHCGSNSADCGGIATEDAGFSFTNTQTFTSTQVTSLWGTSVGAADHGLFTSCEVFVLVTAVSGTTPTMNVYFQDSPDNANFNDRISFTQFTTTGKFYAGIVATKGVTPAAIQTRALTGGTEVDGPIGPYGQLVWVIGGTSPSFTVTYSASCR
jgi:hypothetical protein